jgi:protocatechuate 3,4-dioxygenase, alpha subunit
MAPKQTPSQTIGPYFAYGLTAPQYGYPFTAIAGAMIATEDTEGERIRIVGQVLDGEGTPVNDAMIEIWQANAYGRYNHPADPRTDNYDPAFKGFGRVGTGTDPHNRFIFDTIRPGAIGDGQAPHLNVTVLMRGMLVHAFTRIYFADEEEANAADPVLRSVPEERRGTLIAKREDTPGGTVYRFDIHMQGDAETVFFDV